MRGGGEEAFASLEEAALVGGVESVDVFVGVDAFQEGVGVDAVGEGELEDDAVDGRVGVEEVDAVGDAVGDGFVVGVVGDAVDGDVDAGVGAGGFFAADVGGGGGVVADQEDGQFGEEAVGQHLLGLSCQGLADAACDVGAVDDLGGHGGSVTARWSGSDYSAGMFGDLTCGVDLLLVERFESVLERHGERFVRRICTEREADYCGGRTMELAARFAGKEAVMKALGTGVRGVRWREVEILANARGKPVVVLHGGALRRLRELGLSRMEISLTHERTMVCAFAVGQPAESSRSGRGGSV